MTESDKLIALAERCEAAKAGEQKDLLRETYALCFPNAYMVHPPRSGYRFDEGVRFEKMLHAEAYESAALSLVPEGWEPMIRIGKRNIVWLSGEYGSAEDGTDTSSEIKSECATPALALVTAALRARATQGNPHE